MSRTLLVSQLLPVLQKNPTTNIRSELVVLADEASGHAPRSVRRSEKRTRTWNVSISWLPVLAGTLLFVNAFLLVSYLIGVNSYASKGYEIKSMQAKILEQTTEFKQLTLKSAEANSIAQVEASMTAARFVPVTDTLYIQTPRLTQR